MTQPSDPFQSKGINYIPTDSGGEFDATLLDDWRKYPGREIFVGSDYQTAYDSYQIG
jgi:hypothetical protein